MNSISERKSRIATMLDFFVVHYSKECPEITRVTLESLTGEILCYRGEAPGCKIVSRFLKLKVMKTGPLMAFEYEIFTFGK